MPRHVGYPGAKQIEAREGICVARQIRACSVDFAAAASLAGSAAVAQAQDKGPIRIGFVPPITGPLAFAAVPRWSTASVCSGNRSGVTANGRKIEIVTGDTTCNPDQALTQARRLVSQEKVADSWSARCAVMKARRSRR